MIRAERTPLEGPVILVPEPHGDARGFLVETWRENEVRAAGIADRFVQENHSRSVRGTLRGLHFQAPPGQAKLVRVVRGAIQDVAVDIRRSSPTFGQHVAVVLDDVEHRQLYVPAGFAHGFSVLSPEADVVYRLGSYYDPKLERGVAWDDPALGIQWPFSDPVLSDRDRRNPPLSALDPSLTLWGTVDR
jgi:dTDP-4-dehydrorhamnose 3,5-epimerase